MASGLVMRRPYADLPVMCLPFPGYGGRLGALDGACLAGRRGMCREFGSLGAIVSACWSAGTCAVAVEDSVCGGQELVAYRWRGQDLYFCAEAGEAVSGG